MKYGLPYRVYGGFKFFERKEIKDLTAYLRLLCNPLDNEAVLRVINVPKRGIGEKSIEVLQKYADGNGFSVFDGVFDCDLLDLNNGAKSKIRSFKDIISSLIVDKETMTLTELVKSVIDKTNYMSCFEEKTEENEDKKLNVNELIASVEEFEKQNPQASLSEYLNGITLSSDTDEINDGNFITLATVHSVKGLEYRVVFICGLDREIFPIERNGSIDDDIEEERRLMYVAVTRARERLYITRAKSRFLYGSRRPTFQSEFLNEISDKVALPRDSYSPNRRYQDTDYTQKPSQYGGYRNKSDYGGYGGYSTEESSSPSYGAYKKSFANSYMQNRSKPAATVNNAVGSGDDYKAGTKVIHKKFGEGIIVARKQNGDDVVIDVAFKGIGVKSLVVRYAPIEVVK